MTRHHPREHAKAATWTDDTAHIVKAALLTGLVWVTIIIAALSLPKTADAQEMAATDQSAIQDMIQDQVSAFQANEASRAFSHAAPSIKQMFGNEDRFITMVERQYQPVFRPQSFVFGRLQGGLDRAVQEVFVTGPAGKDWVAVYTLERQEDGNWKISGCYLRPLAGAEV